MLELAKFKAELGQFTGTGHYYFNPLYQEMNYTDGVNYLVATVSAYWLLDIIGTEFFAYANETEPEQLAKEVEEIDPSFGDVIRKLGGNKSLYKVALLMLVL